MTDQDRLTAIRARAEQAEQEIARWSGEQLADQAGSCLVLKAFLKKQALRASNLRTATSYAEAAAFIDAYLEALTAVHRPGGLLAQLATVTAERDAAVADQQLFRQRSGLLTEVECVLRRYAAPGSPAEMAVQAGEDRKALLRERNKLDSQMVRMARERDALRQQVSEMVAPEELRQWRARAEELEAALRELRIDANRLCDRQLGGTYEEDCRRSIAKADAAL